MEEIEDDIRLIDDLNLPVSVTYPEAVETVLKELFPGDDPLDRPDFNVVDYINTLFPTAQSLSSIDEVVAKIHLKLRRVDDDLKEAVRGQTNVGEQGKQCLERVDTSIQDLFTRIKFIKEKSKQSEEMVKEITKDMKTLDSAKRHLSTSITTLNHLHMLVGNLESLEHCAPKRQYVDVSNLLRASYTILEYFNDYLALPKIKELSDKLRKLEDGVSIQIVSEVESALSGGKISNSGELADACLVLDVVRSKYKNDLLKWFVDLQLREYKELFSASQESSWLDKIDRRYAWLKRSLLDYEAKTVLSEVMVSRSGEMDVKLLLFAIQRTANFEGLLDKRFKEDNSTNPFTKLSNNPFEEDMQEEDSLSFQGTISSSFEQHLHIYVNSQDKNLAELMDQFIKELQSVPATSPVLPSCSDLFVFYKRCMVQCSQLSRSKPLASLAVIFQKYLREYAQRVLLRYLPKIAVGTTSINLSSLFKDGSMASILNPEMQSSHKSGQYTDEDLRRVCCVLCTAEYCLETTKQLEEKMKEKVNDQLKSSINMAVEQDLFHNAISQCIQLLVQDLEANCEPALLTMSKTDWRSVDRVGDQSHYVTAIIGHLKQALHQIRDNLASVRKFFTQFCIRFANSFIPKFINHLYKCKMVGTLGAEQLLLDTHSLKTILLDLPSLGSQMTRKAPTSFTKVVVKGMTRAEMILKVVMSPHNQPQAFIENYINLLEDYEISNFQKVLEMKGLKRNEQSILLDLFYARIPSSSLVASSPTHQSAGSSAVQALTSLVDKESKRILKLENILNKKYVHARETTESSGNVTASSSPKSVRK